MRAAAQGSMILLHNGVEVDFYIITNGSGAQTFSGINKDGQQLPQNQNNQFD